MEIIFVSKIAKSGKDTNGNERRIIIIPTDRLDDISRYNGKQVKITIQEIQKKAKLQILRNKVNHHTVNLTLVEENLKFKETPENS